MQKPAEWSLEKLLEYALDAVQQLHNAKVRMASETYRLGFAATMAKPLLPKRGFATWLRANDLPPATVYQAMEVYKHFKDDESALAGLTITQAKEAAGIVSAKTTPDVPEYITSDAPKPIQRVGRGLAELNTAMEKAREELMGMDRKTIIKMAAELSRLAEELTEMAGTAKGKTKHAMASV